MPCYLCFASNDFTWLHRDLFKKMRILMTSYQKETRSLYHPGSNDEEFVHTQQSLQLTARREAGRVRRIETWGVCLNKLSSSYERSPRLYTYVFDAEVNVRSDTPLSDISRVRIPFGMWLRALSASTKEGSFILRGCNFCDLCCHFSYTGICCSANIFNMFIGILARRGKEFRLGISNVDII